MANTTTIDYSINRLDLYQLESKIKKLLLFSIFTTWIFGQSWNEHTVDDACSVYAADVDGDGDMDVLGAAYNDRDITWWGQQGTPSKTVTFTDGSSFSASPTQGGSNQAIGRFQLTSSAIFSLVAATIKLTGTRSCASDFRLWQSSDIQLGSKVEYDPGTDKPITFNNFVSPMNTSGTYYFLTCDVAANATGVIKGVIVSGSNLTFSGGTLSGSISNAALSSGDASLPVELTSFAATPLKVAVLLNWVTETEIDNLGFLIERSLNPNSGFTTIADYRFDPVLQGQGSVTYRTEYAYTDREVVPATQIKW